MHFNRKISGVGKALMGVTMADRVKAARDGDVLQEIKGLEIATGAEKNIQINNNKAFAATLEVDNRRANKGNFR